ncbi:MAG: hypothetical protein ACR2QU_00865, partial [Gammaproteobacteria bacterium]
IADPDQLAADIQDFILQSLTGTTGIIMAREPVSPDWQNTGSPRRLDCRPGNGRYLVGVETSGAGRAQVKIRLLDLDDKAWVPGFAYDWSGRLNSSERALLNSRTSVELLRGQRTLPFQPDQPDLLAARIAFTLGCGLLAQPEIEIRAWVDNGSSDEHGGATLSLVGNYLARADVLRLTDDPDQADVILAAEIHPVDGRLKQYWASLRPAESGTSMPSLEAAAYVSAQGDGPDSINSQQVAEVGSATGLGNAAPHATTNINVVRLPAPCRPGRCDWVGETLDTRVPLPVSDSLVLEMTSEIDQRVFVLAISEGQGLMRLVPSACHGGDGIKIGPGKRLRHPLTAEQYSSAGLSVFVVSDTDSRRSRQLANLVGQVPAGCTSRSLRGEKLERWLQRLDETMNSDLRFTTWNGLRLSFDEQARAALVARR